MAVLASLTTANGVIGDTFQNYEIVEVLDGPGGRYRWRTFAATDLAATLSATTNIVTSSSGTDATLNLADNANAGLLGPMFINQTPAAALPATAARIGQMFVRTGATDPGVYLALDLVGNWVGPIGPIPLQAMGTLTTTVLASNAGVRFRQLSNSFPTTGTTLSLLRWTYTFTDAGMPNDGRVIIIDWSDHADTTPTVSDTGGTPLNRMVAGQITGNGREFSFIAGPANDIVLTSSGSIAVTLRAEDSGSHNNTFTL